MNLLKLRKGKKANRIYIQDKILRDSIFQPGTHYKFIVDVKRNKISILPSCSEKDNIVSKRLCNDGLKPVIDICSREALNCFKNCDYLQISIFDKEVIVEGFEEIGINSSDRNTGYKIADNIVDITQILNVKRRSIVILQKSALRKVSGLDIGQISIDEYFSRQNGVTKDNVLSFRKRLKDTLEIPLKAISFCSGAGLLDKGAINQGFDICWSIDIDEGACKTYSANIGKHIVCGDMRSKNLDIPDAPVMIAGLKCQGFTKENMYTSYLKNTDNELVLTYIDRIKHNKECVVFVIENVPEMLSAFDGHYFNEICSELSDFEISSGVLSAASFGTPQDRQRAIVIGSKVGRINLPKPIYSPSEYRTVRDAFQGLHDGLPNQSDRTAHKNDTLARIRLVKPGGNVFDIPVNLRPNSNHSCSYRRLEWDKPANTIVNMRKALLLHPERHGSISIREGARLFDCENDYVFHGSLSSKQQQVCNAVPIRLAESIFIEIKKAILSFNENLKYGQICLQ